MKNCPVVVLVHGGSWMHGDNRCYGLYSSVGSFLASQGILAVLPNYRVSPKVKHPTHVEDLARAVTWVYQNIEKQGGCRDQIFLLGHSAGGHLVSLLTTDEKYLKAEGLSTNVIRGVVSVSGVYHIPPGSIAVRLGGQGKDGLRLDKMFPVRKDSTAGPPRKDFAEQQSPTGIPCQINLFGFAFGDDEETRKEASPITHVRPGLPPFLLLHADNDLPLLPEMASDFYHALEQNKCDAKSYVVPHRNHNSIMFQAFQKEDPVAQAILGFINSHANGSRAQE